MRVSSSTSEHRESASDIVANCTIITCSDTRTADTDSSGQFIRTRLEAENHLIVEYKIVRDEPVQVRKLVRRNLELNVDVIFLNGGTGIARRDVTYDVIADMLERTLPGFGEIFRSLSFEEIGAASMLSRAVAGTIGGTLIFSMPGSTNAVRLAMDKLIIPELRHLVWEMRR